MSKFKIGDRIRVIKTGCERAATGYYEMLGKEAEIVSEGIIYDWHVKCTEDDSRLWAFNEDELELANEEKTLEDQLKEAETRVSELKAKLEREKNFVDKYEFEFYASSCRPVLHNGGPFDAYKGLGIRNWNPTKVGNCNVKYKLTLERIKE